jgi:hypothetical protein
VDRKSHCCVVKILNEREKAKRKRRQKEKEEKRFSRVTLALLYSRKWIIYGSQRETEILQASINNLMLFHVKDM